MSNRDPWPFENHEAMARLRIHALWIDSCPQRRHKWKEVCNFHGLPAKFIEYDVDTRWNPSFRMLDDVLPATCQFDKFLELQRDLLLPPSANNDWGRLKQLHTILSKFNELTFCSSPVENLKSVLLFQYTTSFTTYGPMCQSAEGLSLP
ncbi:hypothetical protein LIPSTDRAFT_5173 [Lipomyces starkeyi NRRL Y-11557]|uniref:Uncharacterized protein n=1 Tax=Lipomyces starkeyi NRRL Y-11557 TaxID=675824 RepID=A0A1E3Q1X8_LIPST|nr:hypothetical protein LIPSTDRAFT_5173 [Lipomyces starkeyi NRRL Y-11557]